MDNVTFNRVGMKVRRRLAQLDEEGAALDARLSALQAACRSILEL